MKYAFVLILTGMNLGMLAHAEEIVPELERKSPVRHHLMNLGQQRCFEASGVVRKIDPDNLVVTIFHDAIPDLGWPSMTMPFAIRDKVVFSRLKVGEKVLFEFVIEERNSVIVAVK